MQALALPSIFTMHPAQAHEPYAASAMAPEEEAPGDEAPPGTPGTGEDVCPKCGGSGTISAGEPCPECAGSGRVIHGIGGG